MPHRNSRRNTKPLLALLLTAVLSVPLLTATAARADLVGTIHSGTLSETAQQVLSENPALQLLARNAPELLARALEIIAANPPAGAVPRGSFEGLDATEVRLLGRNPALLQVWQSSPEASAELLQLIRTAAGSGKPQK
jgi:hypothetical protein